MHIHTNIIVNITTTTNTTANAIKVLLDLVGVVSVGARDVKVDEKEGEGVVVGAGVSHIGSEKLL